MAVAAKDPAQTTAPASAPAEKVIPSFNEVAAQSAQRRTPDDAPVVDNAPAPAAAPDYRAQYDALPEDLRGWLDGAYRDSYANGIREEYGELDELVPLLKDLKTDPELRASLTEAAKSPEFRKALANPRTRKMIAKLDTDDLIDFLDSSAIDAYRSVNGGAPAAQQKSVDSEAVAQLRAEFQTRDDKTASETWLKGQQSQMQALTAEFPELARPESRPLLEHVVGVSEGGFERAAIRRGIAVYDAKGELRPTWPAEALRAGLSPANYRADYVQYQKTVGKAPPAAPATSVAEAPRPAQAPRTRAEALQAGRDMLAKQGGFNALAARRGRRS